ncbi:AAA family ATPase [Anabaena cylindrica UHCC 0172]|uniref:trifunctional serine/threonine-protein kinase/ATP-binding protein/sensor histidine kinase n=1 Tax=Anabaena cylindrica TaxID=1165 RepID=UPI002B1F61E3|nr:AAA family ATPase [Anabaena cylindrica]MEA5553757.1 AAA family ATPase [Anabaena cylindrica UHCC 0172]
MTSTTPQFREISGYTITEQLYLGSRTAVYRAVQNNRQLPVVIKVLQRKYPTFGELVQFRNQYAIAKNLPIGGIIQPLSLEKFGNSYALVMADWGGVSLEKYIQQHQLDLTDKLAIALQITDILHELHSFRVIHKDIKPANILIHPESKQVKLIDFSIASVLPKETQEIQNPNTLEGTLAYLAPEQTGRMNRGIDYRSDFYAFGVTLYQLFTGRLPFITEDPLELVHCHIAKIATPVHQVNTDVSKMLGAIVAKLMAKNAEDRYQSALGLKHDLDECLSQWKKTGSIAEFELGQRDLCDRFLIPEKLYGREEEVQILLDAFERVAQGASEMMLVAGFSGIGKTAVVNEVHKPILKQRGYFIKGKFDQFNRNIPFSAFVQAFRDLMGQLLSESDTQIQEWKTQILAALGENAQVIVELIPELERIIGVQPTAPELSGTAAQNRFNLLFQRFIQVFTTLEHPLVMFLDDLQWADSASLNLIQVLMAEKQTGHLLLLGAYRDNEVFAAHPLLLTLNDIEKAGATIQTITLQPLSFNSLNHLVADTLHAPATVVQPLTELVMQKTKGNPFFVTQFLKVLHQDELITFDRNAGHWQCDIVQVQDAALTNDVVEFMALQLQKLPESTQHILKLAACVGAYFDLETLAISSEQPQTEVATSLWKALQEGLILPQSDMYKFYLGEAQAEEDQPQETLHYKFLHDRVQQAAYSLIPDEQKQATHLKIGQLLRHNASGQEQEERLFETVNHLNLGLALITERQAQEDLAELNLAAGRKAKLSTAYKTAISYLATGIDLLPDKAWESHYPLTLALHQEITEASYLNTDSEQMEQWAETVLTHARSLLDKITIYEVKIQACMAQNQQIEALQLAKEVLERLGVHLPEQPTHADIGQALQYTQELLDGKSINSLQTLPTMTAAEPKASMVILSSIITAAYHAAPDLLPLVIFAQINLSMQYGNAPESTYSYIMYGLMQIVMLQDIDAGYRFGQFGMNLLQHFHNSKLTAKTILGFNVYLRYFKEPAQDTLNGFLQAYSCGLETGDLEYASLSLLCYDYTAYFCGQELSSLKQAMEDHRQVMQQFGQDIYFNIQGSYYHSVLNLLETKPEPDRLCSDLYDENDMILLHREAHQFLALFQLYFNKLILSYLFERYEQALENARITEQYLHAAAGLIHIPLFSFYDALVQLAIYPTVSQTEQTSILEQVTAHQKHLDQLAVHAPSNQSHRCALVAAEKCRVVGNTSQVIEMYDRAIAGAKENGFIQDEALANELAAKFYLNWGKEKVAAGYMQEAYYCYSRWGAKAKTDDLQQRYPHLLRPILQETEVSAGTWNTLMTIASPTIYGSSTQKSSSSTSINQALDFAAILKASQALSSTIELDDLLHQLTQIILQNSGGDRCALILPNEVGEWQVRAIASLDKTQLCTEPLTNNPNLPLKLIQYVKNTQKTVVIDELKTDLPVIDDYLMERQPKSVLCLPLLNQGQLIGILYLKNHFTVGAFTSDRVEILNFLTTQAAISLENARLYQQSQQALMQLRDNETRFQNLAANIPGMVYQFCLAPDGSTATPYVSFGCLDLYELDPNDVMTGKRSVYAMHHPEDEAAIVQAMIESTQNLTPFIEEWRIITPSGKVKWLQAAARPEKKTDGSVVWDGIVLDVSDRKCAEAAVIQKSQALEQTMQELQNAHLQMVQSEKMASLGNLVAGVAHEINNPIGFLNGSISNAKDNVQDLLEYLEAYHQQQPPTDEVEELAQDIDLEFLLEDLPKLLDAMKGATDRIKNISTSLRTFSRADTDYKVSANLHEGLDSTLLILKYRLKANEHRPAIQITKDYGDLSTIECFPGQLNQVFMNILANAIDVFDEMSQTQSFKEIEANPQQITIRTHVELNQIHIRIRDNGKGMSSDVQAKIFDHLFTTKDVGKGTGLGLVIARQIVVEKHDGSLNVCSEPGQGTEFCISLPIIGSKSANFRW